MNLLNSIYCNIPKQVSETDLVPKYCIVYQINVNMYGLNWGMAKVSRKQIDEQKPNIVSFCL